MLCPKCKVEARVERIKGAAVYVCRKPTCPNYKKPIKATNDSK